MSFTGVKSSSRRIRPRRARKNSLNTTNDSTARSKRCQNSLPKRRFGPVRHATGSFNLWRFSVTREKCGREKNTASCRCSVGCSRGGNGQREKEGAAMSWLAFNPNLSAVGFDDHLTDDET